MSCRRNAWCAGRSFESNRSTLGVSMPTSTHARAVQLIDQLDRQGGEVRR